ncbi:hypothetical protein HB818_03715 [Listeria booriae]|uniref:hypothetical protein n=1 Tax=Listeria booriae TaxID=1552123 RepID=UPI001627B7CD|nr:hypothetical protein [Listeria booriae]MBC1284871.1 hypothetical protein [Listeria booriae]
MGILKVVKKPILAEAVQFVGENQTSIDSLTELCGSLSEYNKWFSFRGGVLFVQTLEGEFRVTKGSYVIKGNSGEYWAIKEHIFKETYEIK